MFLQRAEFDRLVPVLDRLGVPAQRLVGQRPGECMNSEMSSADSSTPMEITSVAQK